MSDERFTNGSGVNDPTAGYALDEIGKADTEDQLFFKLLKIIWQLCALAGFQLQGRICVKSIKTGRIYK